MKIKWRQILLRYKTKKNGSSVGIPKADFPKLLKEVLQCLEEGNGTENMKSGFKKCGIYPLNRNEVLQRLPSCFNAETTNTTQVLNDTVIDYLKELRHGNESAKTTKRKKVNVPAGRSYLVEDITGTGGMSNEQSGDSSDEEELLRILEKQGKESCAKKRKSTSDTTNGLNQNLQLKVGNYVQYVYEGEKFPGMIIEEKNRSFKIKSMQMVRPNIWKWPDRDDIEDYPVTNILKILKEPEPAPGVSSTRLTRFIFVDF
jgi:hypothetical protein